MDIMNLFLLILCSIALTFTGYKKTPSTIDIINSLTEEDILKIFKKKNTRFICVYDICIYLNIEYNDETRILLKHKLKSLSIRIKNDDTITWSRRWKSMLCSVKRKRKNHE